MKPSKDVVAANGWTMLFADGEPGFNTTPHVGAFTTLTGDQVDTARRSIRGDVFYRCRITVELLKDKRGRYIRRSV